MARDSISEYPSLRSARGTVWLTIAMLPPPTSFLNFTSPKSGSIPVVSQSINRPMVPVGASTEAWALRTPWRAPRSTASSHECCAASRISTGANASSIR